MGFGVLAYVREIYCMDFTVASIAGNRIARWSHRNAFLPTSGAVPIVESRPQSRQRCTYTSSTTKTAICAIVARTAGMSRKVSKGRCPPHQTHRFSLHLASRDQKKIVVATVKMGSSSEAVFFEGCFIHTSRTSASRTSASQRPEAGGVTFGEPTVSNPGFRFLVKT